MDGWIFIFKLSFFSLSLRRWSLTLKLDSSSMACGSCFITVIASTRIAAWSQGESLKLHQKSGWPYFIPCCGSWGHFPKLKDSQAGLYIYSWVVFHRDVLYRAVSIYLRSSSFVPTASPATMTTLITVTSTLLTLIHPITKK